MEQWAMVLLGGLAVTALSGGIGFAIGAGKATQKLATVAETTEKHGEAIREQSADALALERRLASAERDFAADHVRLQGLGGEMQTQRTLVHELRDKTDEGFRRMATEVKGDLAAMEERILRAINGGLKPHA